MPTAAGRACTASRGAAYSRPPTLLLAPSPPAHPGAETILHSAIARPGVSPPRLALSQAAAAAEGQAIVSSRSAPGAERTGLCNPVRSQPFARSATPQLQKQPLQKQPFGVGSSSGRAQLTPGRPQCGGRFPGGPAAKRGPGWGARGAAVARLQLRGAALQGSALFGRSQEGSQEAATDKPSVHANRQQRRAVGMSTERPVRWRLRRPAQRMAPPSAAAQQPAQPPAQPPDVEIAPVAGLPSEATMGSEQDDAALRLQSMHRGRRARAQLPKASLTQGRAQPMREEMQTLGGANKTFSNGEEAQNCESRCESSGAGNCAASPLPESAARISTFTSRFDVMM